ncbi:MAG: DHA2 family efflux MFS transporter permease subunit [Alphaproteobacteria bacterium]|nr:DHA2 family efflux MFS transporter permease subunit [Alphaproteobacteria bacterium]
MPTAAIEALFERYGPKYRVFVTFTAILGVVAMLLNATMINVAIPVIMGAFGVGQDTVHWLATGYIAAMTVAMLLNDWFVRTFGMRATYLGAMSIFTIGAVMGGLSANIETMIVARLLQGTGAGLVQPLSMVLMYQIFPVHQRGKAMGLFGLGVVVAPTLGPTLGGVLLDGFNWHYVFFTSVPVAGLGSILAWLFMPWRSGEDVKPRFDWTGLVLLVTFVGSLLIGLSSGQREGWHAPIIAVYFSIFALSLLSFLWWEWRVPDPILQLRLFLNREFAAAAVVRMALGAGLYGTTYLIPLFVQTVQSYSPTRSGLLMVPAGLTMMLLMPVGGRLADRLPRHWLILGGLFAFAASALLMTSAHTDTPFWTFASWLVVGRIGLAFVIPTINVTALRSLSGPLLSQGSGAVNFMRILGGALGVNLIAVALEHRTAVFSQALAGMQTPDNILTQELMQRLSGLLSQLGWPIEMHPQVALYMLGDSLYAQASMLAFRDVFLYLGLVYFVAMLPALLLRERKQKVPAMPSAARNSEARGGARS